MDFVTKTTEQTQKQRLADFLEAKFLAWEAETGRRQKLSAWAAHLGVTRAVLNNYMKQQRLPRGKNLELLARTLGPELYDILGMQRRYLGDKLWDTLAQYWPRTPENIKRRIAEQVEKYAAREESKP